MSGVTLMHSESDVEPECSVVFGAGRLTGEDRTDSRRIELTFKLCYYARLGPHDDSEGVEGIGYRIDSAYGGDPRDYWAWRCQEWKASGNCPDSGFYVARQSAWLSTLPRFFRDFRHYVIDGRDGYVELIAREYKWREWIWAEYHREDGPSKGTVVGSGEGVA